jgi:hypothetical protein
MTLDIVCCLETVSMLILLWYRSALLVIPSPCNGMKSHDILITLQWKPNLSPFFSINWLFLAISCAISTALRE